MLLIHPVRSLDDAIDFANSDGGESSLSSLSIFGTPEVAKYLSQFVDAQLCWVNDIPVELLVGSARPDGHAARFDVPYTRDMFSMRKDEFIQFPKKSLKLCHLLDHNKSDEASKIREAAESLDTRVVEHFEQGFLVGASVLLATFITANVLFWKNGYSIVARSLRY